MATSTNADRRDWVTTIADRVVHEADRRAPGHAIVCASGISPSGPIHLGNLREIMVPHFVADEIRHRGRACEHILSWDDYDRLRRLPAGVAEEFGEHLGRPLSEIPDPAGQDRSWAEHYKAPFRAALEALGVEIREISQAEMYTSGRYTAQVLRAMDARARIGEALATYRTRQRDRDEDDLATGHEYWPYRPYCGACDRDTTQISAYDGHGRLSYRCDTCGHDETRDLRTDHRGKLTWKVDWPMRWAYEGVTFEAGGVDHSSPGSSFAVGSELVREVFDGEPPIYVAYSFVGTRGMAKMSGSQGTAPTPADALRVLEAPILRWVYARRTPNKQITIDFGDPIMGLYDEWDRLGAKVATHASTEADTAIHERAASTSRARLPVPRVVIPFRMLSSLVDITAGDALQIRRIIRDARDDRDLELVDVQPRVELAQNWVREHMTPEARTTVRVAPAALSELDPEQREAIDLLLSQMPERWTLEGLTRLLYGIPKLQRGLDLDAAAWPELKQAQREFFKLLYGLLIAAETGPRLPTLLLAIGQEQLRGLLGAETASRAAG